MVDSIDSARRNGTQEGTSEDEEEEEGWWSLSVVRVVAVAAEIVLLSSWAMVVLAIMPMTDALAVDNRCR